MAHLIDKDALVAEIERLRDAALTRQHNLERIGQVTSINEQVAFNLNKVLSFIDTLEVEEVDLDFAKEADMWIRDNEDTSGFFNVQELAKHFFELGLKAKQC